MKALRDRRYPFWLAIRPGTARSETAETPLHRQFHQFVYLLPTFRIHKGSDKWLVTTRVGCVSVARNASSL